MKFKIVLESKKFGDTVIGYTNYEHKAQEQVDNLKAKGETKVTYKLNIKEVN